MDQRLDAKGKGVNAVSKLCLPGWPAEGVAWSLHAAEQTFELRQDICMNSPFELPQEMTIYSAIETRDALLTWVTEQTGRSVKLLEISAANVCEIDGAGLQLLAALANMDHPWRLVKPSVVFADACRTLGLSAWLDTSATPS